MKRSGFTMIELIFVIVILGILAAVAIPKLAATRDDAELAARATQAQTSVNEIGAYVTARNAFAPLMETMSVAAGAMVNSGQAVGGANSLVINDTRPTGTAQGCLAIVQSDALWTGDPLADETALNAAVAAVTVDGAGGIAGNVPWVLAGNFVDQTRTKILVVAHNALNVSGGCDVLRDKIPAGFTIVKGRSAQF